jgi:hypothetical protein
MRPDPERVEHYRGPIAQQPAGLLRLGWSTSWIASRLQRIAQTHAAGCAGCVTCFELRDSLAFILAFELEELPDHVLRNVHGVGTHNEGRPS